MSIDKKKYVFACITDKVKRKPFKKPITEKPTLVMEMEFAEIWLF